MKCNQVAEKYLVVNADACVVSGTRFVSGTRVVSGTHVTCLFSLELSTNHTCARVCIHVCLCDYHFGVCYYSLFVTADGTQVEV